MTLAVTGATGFVGARLLDIAVSQDHRVRALTRRPQGLRDGITWIDGALDNTDALRALCDGADAVIHVAGVINASDAAGFEAGNVVGTLAMLAAATASGVHRFVHVSSLAAREPALSMYGASKARSEELVEGSGLDWSIVRPPAVYGPGDKETLELFRMAKRGVLLMPPTGRASYIHVDDLARLLLALAQPDAPKRQTFEPDDGHAGGWTHTAFGAALGNALGKRVTVLQLPRWLLRAGSVGDRLLRRGGAKLTPDRVTYFCHPDWAVDGARAVPTALWTPGVPTQQGLADTADWYKSAGWL